MWALLFSSILSFTYTKSVSIDSVIQDVNIKLSSNGSFITQNTSQYDVSNDSRKIVTKDAKKTYFYKGTKDNGSLYTISKDADGTRVNRYRVEKGTLSGITMCEHNVSPFSKTDDNDVLICQFMQNSYCDSFMQKAKKLRGKEKECIDWLGEIKKTYPNSKAYIAHAEKAIRATDDFASNSGLDVNVVWGEEYRSRMRKDVIEKDHKLSIQRLQETLKGFEHAYQICKEIGYGTPSKADSSNKKGASK